MAGPKIFWIDQGDRVEDLAGDSSNISLYPGRELSRHLLSSLRAKEGDSFPFSDPETGTIYRGTLVSREPCSLKLDVESGRISRKHFFPRLGIVFSPLKGDSFSEALSMAVMAGIDILQPVISDRSIVRWPEGDGWASKAKRFAGIVREKSQLAGRATRMRIASPLSLRESLKNRASDVFLWFDEDPVGALDPMKAIDSLRRFPIQFWEQKTIWSVVGPEGGWSPRDRDFLRDPEEKGSVFRISLGERIFSGEMALLTAILFLGTFLAPALSRDRQILQAGEG
ncbi:RsmE family RNA methyltransferase [Leptospirillum ferriphilum]|uniref:16S rRNA (uracil(1498)-N(3))-methyltransferase n=1 Tax=Leptospirillum ferriphilum TaxID=178606 RepID=A0A1V3STQ6_9BACT|nr:RsmE family RNA methyltransferase [Leptospirillum ferriphilum]OOH71030.1 hypothetical protein BOX24_09685 [Leptospirillum ferriphilum]